MALKERGIDFRPELVVETENYAYETGVEAVTRLLKSGVKFDGIVAACDTHGLAAINTLVRAGIRVPEDVKVTGVDNAPFCRYGLVELTSVSQEFQVRGGLAARMLLDSLSGTPMSSSSVPPAISVRRSTER
jgi:DNA-binding LacI/PurR family transcriptional regulator